MDDGGAAARRSSARRSSGGRRLVFKPLAGSAAGARAAARLSGPRITARLQAQPAAAGVGVGEEALLDAKSAPRGGAAGARKARQTAPPNFARAASQRFAAGGGAAAARPAPVMLARAGRAKTQKELHESLAGVPYCTTCKVYLDRFAEAATPEAAAARGGRAGAVETRRARGLLAMYSQRWAVLSGEHLALYERQDDAGRVLPQAVVHLDRCPTRDPKPGSRSFVLSAPAGDLSIRCASAGDKAAWLGLLRRHDAGLRGAGDAAAAHTHFCDDCESYVDLDRFTLAEADGPLRVARPGVAGAAEAAAAAAAAAVGGELARGAERWVALAAGHVAVYEGEAGVTDYAPLAVVHAGGHRDVSPAGSAAGDRLLFTVGRGDARLVLEAPDADAYAAWLKALLREPDA